MTTQGWPVVAPPGLRVGPYRVDAGIATGSWGSVYAATLVEDPGDGEGSGVVEYASATVTQATGQWPAEAALKFLPAGRLTPVQRGMIGELLDREIRFGERVAGPYLACIYAVLEVRDTGETGETGSGDGEDEVSGVDGAVVLVMERARQNVRDVLDSGEPGAPVQDAPRLLAELAEAVASLHDQGWVHADLKPQNLLVMRDGSLRVADFGLSAELEGTHAYVPNLGSTDYLPPEWWNEQLAVRGVAVRPAGDVWAYGVIAHELLTGGQHPFPGATARARSAAVREVAAGHGEPRVNSRLAPAWRDLITDCLIIDPAERSERTRRLAERVRGLAGVPALGEMTGEHLEVAGEQATTAGSATAASKEASDANADHTDGGDPASEQHEPRRTCRWWAVAAVSALALVVGIGGGSWLVSRSPGSDSTDSQPDAAKSASPQAQSARGATDSGYPPRAGDLRSDAAVPAAYREQIIHAGRNCPEHKSITPALIAGMLSAESDFNPDKRSPSTNEYGIALWTPHLLKQWVRGGDAMNPDDSIRGVGRYLCWAAKDLAPHRNLDTPHPRLLVAAYRTSTDKVAAARGVPAEVADHVAEVERKRKGFARPWQ